jgi:hypothetical protein
MKNPKNIIVSYTQRSSLDIFLEEEKLTLSLSAERKVENDTEEKNALHIRNPLYVMGYYK